MQNDGPEEEGFRAGIVMGPDGKPGDQIICYPSFTPNCIVVVKPSKSDVDSSGFVSPGEPTGYHDHGLVNATAKINEILAEVIDNHGRDDGGLHVIAMPDGPMFAWVKAMVVQSDDVRKDSGFHRHG